MQQGTVAGLKREIMVLFGIGPLELVILVAIPALLFGLVVVKRLGWKLGRTVGAGQTAIEEFERGRDEG